jgi:hypothetical protein
MEACTLRFKGDKFTQIMRKQTNIQIIDYFGAHMTNRQGRIQLQVPGWVFFIFLMNSSIFMGCFGEKPSDRIHPLKEASLVFNATCPRMVDQDTRLDSGFFVPDQIFQYDYTLVNYDAERIDAEGLARYLKPRIRDNVRTNTEMKIQRDHQVTMIFYYRDRKGDFITKVILTPEEY